jgi:sugar O-acyltransferase (sialic acid O-acetyltransferase NeuD family)
MLDFRAENVPGVLTTPRMISTLIFGSSGHASVLIDVMGLTGEFKIAGFLDDTEVAGTVKKGHAILGGFQDYPAISKRENCKSVVLAIGDNWWRRKIYNELKQFGFQFPIIKHPSAIIASVSELGAGAVVLANAHVGPGANVGKFCILNSGSSVDHDCTLADFSSLAPGVFMGGFVEVGECSHIGVGASISDRKRIGKHTVVGTGSVVIRDIPDFVVAYGNPAEVRRSREEAEKYYDS